MAELFNKGYALLIGVGECVDPTLSLSVTVQDMKALRQILVDPALCAYPDNDQHIQILHDQTATRSGILDSLAQLRDRVATDPEATVIVYYSGHGWLEKDTNSYYLIPNDFDPYEWRTTALSATDFNQALQAIPAKRLLVILDCCHAAGIGTAKDTTSLSLPKGVVPSADPKGILDALTQGEGRVVFTSCRGEEQSWVRQDKTLSVYTHHLIEALQGAASQAGTTEVTIFDLANHLGKAVPATAATMNQKQNPRFEMRDTERFAIALLQGGKGLSSGGWKATQPTVPASGNQTQVSASGERAIAIDGNTSGGVFVTGDGNVVGHRNVVQHGRTNINTETFTGHIGDNYSPQGDYVAGDKIGGDKVMGNKTSMTTQEQAFQPVKYICPDPDCDKVWVKRAMGQEAPKCSIHDVKMVSIVRS
jgi:Caspase domain